MYRYHITIGLQAYGTFDIIFDKMLIKGGEASELRNEHFWQKLIF